MKIPIIIYSDKLLDRIGIFMKIGGITLFPWIILRERYKYGIGSIRVLKHENIHIEQQKEMLLLPFYVWYVSEYLIKRIFYGSGAYRALSFEREAYQNERTSTYLSTRKRYAWLKYVFKKQ